MLGSTWRRNRPVIALALAVVACAAVSLAATPPDTGSSPTVSSTPEGLVSDVLRVEKEWAHEFLQNDAAGIERYMSDDWVLIGPDGALTGKESFLATIRSGALTHDVMILEEPRVRIYGDTAVVTGRARSSGKFGGAPFSSLERSTDVFVRHGTRWLCVLTHLTRLALR